MAGRGRKAFKETQAYLKGATPATAPRTRVEPAPAAAPVESAGGYFSKYSDPWFSSSPVQQKTFAQLDRERGERLAVEIRAASEAANKRKNVNGKDKAKGRKDKRLDEPLRNSVSAASVGIVNGRMAGDNGKAGFSNPLYGTSQTGAYALALAMVERIKAIMDHATPHAEQDAICSELDQQPELANKVGHLLLKQGDVSTDKIKAFIASDLKAQKDILKSSAKDAFEGWRSSQDPETYIALLRRAIKVFSPTIFYLTEETVDVRLNEKIVKHVEDKVWTKIKSHNVTADEAVTWQEARTINGMEALATKGFAPFKYAQPSDKEEETHKDQLVRIREMEAANKVVRWLLLAYLYENPASRREYYDYFASKTVSKTVSTQEPVKPQPALIAMAQKAMADVEPTELWLALGRFGADLKTQRWVKAKLPANNDDASRPYFDGVERVRARFGVGDIK